MTDPNEPTSAQDPPELRLSPEEREAAIGRLSDAFARDLLPLEELERRLDGVYGARTRVELARLTADLPAHARTMESPAVGLAAIPPIHAVFANVERGGSLTIPRDLEIRATFSNVELDLTSAVLQPGATEISVRATIANVEIRLPPGVRVENRAEAVLASVECRSPAVPPADPPLATVLITGRAVLANVEVSAG